MNPKEADLYHVEGKRPNDEHWSTLARYVTVHEAHNVATRERARGWRCRLISVVEEDK